MCVALGGEKIIKMNEYLKKIYPLFENKFTVFKHGFNIPENIKNSSDYDIPKNWKKVLQKELEFPSNQISLGYKID